MEMVADCTKTVDELFPWDLAEELEQESPPMIIDVREESEYKQSHIPNSLFIPRGLLEMACEWDYDDTVPELAKGREQNIIVVCRSGHRSLLAAKSMQQLGFTSVRSLKTGLKGWNDDEQPLVDIDNNLIDVDVAEEFFISKLRPEQLKKNS